MSKPHDEGPLFDPLNLDDAFPSEEPSPEPEIAPSEEVAATDPFATDPFAAAGIPSEAPAEPTEEASAEAAAPVTPAGKKAKKSKKAKTPKPPRERKPSTSGRGFGASIASTSVYMWMLCLSFLALILGCVFLYIELSRYNFDIKAEEGKRVAQAPSLLGPAPADRLLA